jgi:hypothetical protein
MPRWITITSAPFDFVWPGRASITHFSTKEIGLEVYAKDELADFAVAGGFAKEGKASEDSTTKSTKSGPKAPRVRRRRSKAATTPANRRAFEEPKAPRKPGKKSLAAVASETKPGDSAVDASAANIREDAPVDAAHSDEDGALSNGGAVDSGAS